MLLNQWQVRRGRLANCRVEGRMQGSLIGMFKGRRSELPSVVMGGGVDSQFWSSGHFVIRVTRIQLMLINYISDKQLNPMNIIYFATYS